MNQADEMLLPREIPAKAEVLLEQRAPSRQDVVVCGECLFTWYWVAELCADQGIPFVLGHALYRKAIHGGKTKNNRIDSKTIAKRLRAGMIPMAYVYPKAMRSTRDLLRWRMHFMRHRADLRTPIQQTNVHYPLPKIGKTLKCSGNREGVAERFDDGSVRKSGEVDLERIGFYDRLIGTLERHLQQCAKEHDTRALQVLRTIPGIGKILSLGMLSEVQDISRFPTPQKCASSARLIRPGKESAGTRTGTATGKMGNAYVKWAFSEARVLFLRETREAQPSIRRLERKYGTDKARGILAHRLGRTVYYLFKHTQIVDLNNFVNQQHNARNSSKTARNATRPGSKPGQPKRETRKTLKHVRHVRLARQAGMSSEGELPGSDEHSRHQLAPIALRA